MPRTAKTERPKEVRSCHLHGDVLHVQTIHHRRADGSAAYQWRCMTCRNETSRAYQYNRRRELKADTRGTVRPLAPLVEGAERPASQTLPASPLG